MNNTINIVKNDVCTGCKACFNICPKGAIYFVEDEEGFIQPNIDEEKCIDCGQCKKVCSIIDYKFKNTKSQKCYAAQANYDIRKMSSSGGIFTLLAKHIINKGGVVAGAAFDSEFQLKHILVDNEKDLDKLRGSKYLQSDINDVYKQVNKVLEESRPVLFTGTPCQIAGITKYIELKGTASDNLYCIDLVCHGVPSQKIFNKFLDEITDRENIKEIQFRDKSKNGWGCSSTSINSNGITISNSDYHNGFLSNLFLRKSCSVCKYAQIHRTGDITLADFWSIEKYDKKLNDNFGTSMILVNSEKGKKLFNEIKNELSLLKEIPLKFALKTSYHLRKKTKAHPERSRFFELLKNHSFKRTLDIILNGKYDAVVIGCGYTNNYGANLTNWALLELLKEFGCEAIMLDKIKPIGLGHINRKIYSKNGLSRKFLNKYITKTKIYETEAELSSELNQIADVFIIGSDQLWNINLAKPLDDFYFLNWVNEDKKKISYSTSFGFNHWPGDEYSKLEPKYLLKRIDYISVRENSAVELLKNEFNMDSVQILDPVFSIEPEKYDKLIKNSKLKTGSNYIASYILDSNPFLSDALNYISKLMNKELKCVLNEKRVKKNFKVSNILNRIEVEDFLNIFKNSDFVVTNSYHGVCFAIIFKKPFVCVVNNRRGGARFESLLKILNLEDRMVYNIVEIYNNPELFKPIDYDSVYKIINEKREFARNWLLNAIKSPKQQEISEYDVLLKEIYKRDIMLEKLKNSKNIFKKIFSI